MLIEDYVVDGYNWDLFTDTRIGLMWGNSYIVLKGPAVFRVECAALPELNETFTLSSAEMRRIDNPEGQPGYDFNINIYVYLEKEIVEPPPEPPPEPTWKWTLVVAIIIALVLLGGAMKR